MCALYAHPAEAHPAAEALGGRAVGLQEVAQREAGQLIEAGGVGGLEEACESQLQATVHPTYIAALNTRHQSVIGIRVTFWYVNGSADPYHWITGPDPDPALS
jgi:hypothetical protein